MSKLLIVDNENLQRTAICLAAKDAGFTEADLATATSREEAESLLGRPFDLAVVDLALRGDHDEEGVDLIRALHRRRPGCKIIALTTHRHNDAGVRAMRAGATYFINSHWREVNWQELLKENLSILRQLVEDPPAA